MLGSSFGVLEFIDITIRERMLWSHNRKIISTFPVTIIAMVDNVWQQIQIDVFTFRLLSTCEIYLSLNVCNYYIIRHALFVTLM